jgi:hypothetical protein
LFAALEKPPLKRDDVCVLDVELAPNENDDPPPPKAAGLFALLLLLFPKLKAEGEALGEVPKEPKPEGC